MSKFCVGERQLLSTKVVYVQGCTVKSTQVASDPSSEEIARSESSIFKSNSFEMNTFSTTHVSSYCQVGVTQVRLLRQPTCRNDGWFIHQLCSQLLSFSNQETILSETETSPAEHLNKKPGPFPDGE